MKGNKLIASALMVGALTVSLTSFGGIWTAVTGECEEAWSDCGKDENGNWTGAIHYRTGSDTWCMNTGTSDCDPADCVYGAWQTTACQ